MKEFEAKSLCILGRQPALGLAELESLYGTEHVRPMGEVALLDIAAEEINFKRLGGTIKTARILVTLPYTEWKSISKYLRDKIPEHLSYVPEGKFTLGISVYGLPVKVNDLNKTNMELKKLIRATGRPVRVVPNKNLELNSAQVLHNQLTRRGAWELLLVKNGTETILAQTLFVQDIEAYAARDQARPARDARVGMLPPKLAQIIVNMAVADSDEWKRGAQVYDPFCGTGVILQEANLMGWDIVGSDIDPGMIEYSEKNLRWLAHLNSNLTVHDPDNKYFHLEVADAAKDKLPVGNFIASEVYLGRPLTKLPDPAELKQIISDTNTIIKKFLANIGAQVKPGTRFCLAVPAWRKPNGEFIHLPVIDHLTDMGYNYLDFKHVQRNDLIYYRKDQTVARQLITLEKI